VVILRRFLAEDTVDVINVFSASAAVLVFLARISLFSRVHRRVPVVGSVMGLQSSATERALITHGRVWMTALGVRTLVVISPAIEAIVRRLPISRNRIRHVATVGIDMPEPGDPKRISALRRCLLGREADALVMTVGQLEPRKSHDLFVLAARSVVDVRPQTRFVVVGQGKQQMALVNQVADLGLQDHILFVGERTDVDDLLACADVYVKPGIVEGFIGITVLEAQAARVPVVAFDTRDVRMAITSGATGWIVSPGDTTALSVQILRLLQEPHSSSAIVESAYRQVVERFEINVAARALERLYLEMVSSRTLRD